VELLRQLLSGDQAVLTMGLIFVAVVLAVLGVGALFTRDPVKRRLSSDTSVRETIRRDKSGGKGGAPTLRASQDREGVWDEIVKPLEKYFMDQKEGSESNLRTRLMQAGFTGSSVVRNYFLIRTILAVGVPAAFLFLLPILGIDMSVRKIMVATAGLALAGLYLPGIFISSRVDKRHQAIAEAFPDALDMLVVCVEAGLGLDAAFTRVGAQIAPAHPILAGELGMVSLELRAGKSRADALRNFAKRIDLREVSSFVTLLLQSDALGTSIGQTLRVHAEEMRARRMLRAEEMAHKLPVKMTIPLVLCILPAMFAAVMLPGMLTISRVIIPALG
jgi:tight adherence protein C